jgi:Trk K+ transport system NAD-binding subunit
MGVITPGINASFVIMAIITCFVSPVIYNLMSPVNPYAGEKVIIIGGSSTGVLLARRLALHGKKSVIVESLHARASEISSKGLPCLEGDGRDAELYQRLQMKAADYVYVDTGLPEVNYAICKMLRQELRHDNIISRGRTSDIELELKRLGIDTLDVIRVLATTIENLVLRPATYHALVESFEHFSVEEVLITNKDIDGLPVREIPFDKDAILIMVKRGTAFLIPQPETYLRSGDILMVFGTDTAIQGTREVMEGKRKIRA